MGYSPGFDAGVRFPQVAGPLKSWFSLLTTLLSIIPLLARVPSSTRACHPLDGAAWFSTDEDVSGRTARDHATVVHDLLSAPPLPGSRHRMAHSAGHLDVSGTPARPAVERSAVPGGARIEVGVCDRNLLGADCDCDSHTPGVVSLGRDSSPSPHLSTSLSPYGPVSSRALLSAPCDARSWRFARSPCGCGPLPRGTVDRALFDAPPCASRLRSRSRIV